MVLSLTAEADVAEWVLHNGLEDVRRLHPDLLGEAAMGCSACAALLHVKLIHHNLKDIELLRLQISEQLLVSLVGGIEILLASPGSAGLRAAHTLLINLIKEAASSILQLNHLLSLELLQVGLVRRLLFGMVALVHHI